MAYWQWGSAEAPHVVVCVHGLSRQGRDFDVLAGALLASSDHPLRVICPDVAGRGRSDWLENPSDYQLPVYAADMLLLLQHLRAQAAIEALDWVGTSMGGLIGLAIAAKCAALPLAVRRLLLNDVGPAIQWQALQRIGAYLGKSGRFQSVQEAADAMWAVSTSFGPHTQQQWLALSQPMVRPLHDGGFALHYDPAIAAPFGAVTQEMAAQGEAVLWTLYDAVQADTLITRGEQSDLLLHATALEMTRRGPCARLVEFAGVGHAPTFVTPQQVEVATSFLLSAQLA